MKNYPDNYFNLINEEDKRIFDKEFKTKQLSYFQDAMLRFGKNKYNVIASIILLMLIILSIVVPIITPKELYTENNSQLRLLPPRIPILENIGIADGTRLYKNITVDPDTISETTGLGYPTEGFNIDFIDFTTLENYTQIGTLVHEDYKGGTNEITIEAGKSSYAIATKEKVSISSSHTMFFDIEIDGRGYFEVYAVKSVAIGEMSTMETTSDGDEIEIVWNIVSTTVNGVEVQWGDTDFMTYLGSTENLEADENGIVAMPVESTGYGLIVVRYVLPEGEISDGTDFVSLTSIYTTTGDVDGTPIKFYEGFDLASFSQVNLNPDTEGGFFLRVGAERLVASFVYDKYSALFDDKEVYLPGSEYEEILASNEGMAESIVVSASNPESWTFGEGYPITKVVGYSSRDMEIDGEMQTFITYTVMIDGKYALGFDDVPYFLFGTDVAGKDLFTLIWLGLRTSLLLGFLAAITNIFVGIIWGSVSGYYGGQVDILMERFTDIWGSFPQITMISIITVIIGPGFLALYIFMVYDGWIGAAKITRMQFYRYKGREYVLAARTLGASDSRIIFKHILPNALGTIVTRMILSIPSVIFLEVVLSYLGFGIGNGQKLTIGPLELTGTSIGVILNDGQAQILAGNTWLIIFPTIIVSILMITFNMFGNALRDALNPQLRGSN